MLAESIVEIRAGKLDPRVANALGYLGASYLRALEVSDIESRLDALEGTQLAQERAILQSNPSDDSQQGSALSANLTKQARELVARFKLIDGVKVKERGALQLEKNLQDDYIKFLAFAEDRLGEQCILLQPLFFIPSGCRLRKSLDLTADFYSATLPPFKFHNFCF